MEKADGGRGGRPRSERAREAVLHAVDDLLLDEGYAAMTMKGIAERAGVGRQTVYRWWSNKAEILLEASVIDAREELAVSPTGDPTRDLTAYVQALVTFLTRSAAGAAYRALLGEAQHDQAIADLMVRQDLLGNSAHAVLLLVAEPDQQARVSDQLAALLIGPVLYWIISGAEPTALSAGLIVDNVLAALAGRLGSVAPGQPS